MTGNDTDATSKALPEDQESSPTLSEIGAFLKRCDPRLIVEYVKDDINLETALWHYFNSKQP